MAIDFTEFLEMSAEDLYEDWLTYITSRDPLLQDTGVATFNSILAEAVSTQFWVFIQLLKQKVKDSNVLTAEGDALSAIVLSMLPEGRQPGTNATGVIIFSRSTPASSDITIPANTICAAVAEDGTLTEFQTDDVAILATGNTQVYVPRHSIRRRNSGERCGRADIDRPHSRDRDHQLHQRFALYRRN